MPNRELRQSQVITTFGPGSIVDYGGESFMISIADDWEYPRGDAIGNHIITDEKRLLNRLNCQELEDKNAQPKKSKKWTSINKAELTKLEGTEVRISVAMNQSSS